MNWVILLLIALVVVGIFWVTRRPNGEPSRRKPELATSRADYSYEIAEELPFPSQSVPEFEPRTVPDPSRPFGEICFAGNILNILPRDPQTLYIYWEFVNTDDNPLSRLSARYGSSGMPVLRIYQLNLPWFAPENIACHYDHAVDPSAGNWYVQVPYPHTVYCAELGFLLHSGEFIGVVRSREVLTPRDSVSPILDPNWPPLPGLQYGTGLADRTASSLSKLTPPD